MRAGPLFDLPAQLLVALRTGEAQTEPARVARDCRAAVARLPWEPDAKHAAPHGGVREIPELEGARFRNGFDLRRRRLVALVVDQADDPCARGPAEINPAPVGAVERDVEFVVLPGGAQRVVEELAPL